MSLLIQPRTLRLVTFGYGNSIRAFSTKEVHCDDCSCKGRPGWSFYKRKLPHQLIALSSSQGKKLLSDTMKKETCESYFPLIEQFLTQSDPSFCGLTTLAMVLNALSVDPRVRWKGIWRWFDEDLLLKGCCLRKQRIQKVGITMEEFQMLGRCQGAKIEIKRANDSMDSFRNDLLQVIKSSDKFLVTSFDRKKLNQTGSGHFSPIAAFHEKYNMVLILDVARFKYAPYWVPLHTLYESMTSVDLASGLPRGWFLISSVFQHNHEKKFTTEVLDRSCPAEKIKMTFCKMREPKLPIKQRQFKSK